MKILLIEDEPLFADRMEMLVEKLGHTPLGPVDNADDALRIVRENTPDLALIDVNIVGAYDGIETADLLQKIATFPYIFVTSLEDDQTFARASRGRPVNFIIKPFDDVQLRRAIMLALLPAVPGTAPLNHPPDDHGGSHGPEGVVLTPSAPQPAYDSNTLLYVKVGKKLRQLRLGTLLSFTADGRYCSVRWREPDGSAHRAVVRESLNDLAARLPEPPFLRVHRSMIVNENHVTAVDLPAQLVYLSDGSQAPLAKRRKSLFANRSDLLK